jgi:hypothetical protein
MSSGHVIYYPLLIIFEILNYLKVGDQELHKRQTAGYSLGRNVFSHNFGTENRLSKFLM